MYSYSRLENHSNLCLVKNYGHENPIFPGVTSHLTIKTCYIFKDADLYDVKACDVVVYLIENC